MVQSNSHAHNSHATEHAHINRHINSHTQNSHHATNQQPALGERTHCTTLTRPSNLAPLLPVSQAKRTRTEQLTHVTRLNTHTSIGTSTHPLDGTQDSPLTTRPTSNLAALRGERSEHGTLLYGTTLTRPSQSNLPTPGERSEHTVQSNSHTHNQTLTRLNTHTSTHAHCIGWHKPLTRPSNLPLVSEPNQIQSNIHTHNSHAPKQPECQCCGWTVFGVHGIVCTYHTIPPHSRPCTASRSALPSAG